MNLNAISPYVRRAMHSQMRAPFKIGQRIIFDYELIYIASGKFLLTVDKKDYICKKGDFIFLRPGHLHTLANIDGIDISQPHIHFDLSYDEYSDKVYISFKDIDRFSDEEKKMIRRDELDIGPIIRVEDEESFKKIFFEIIDIHSKKPPLYQLECKEKMIKLIGMIIADNTVSYEKEDPFVTLPAMIKHYIDYNFANVITLTSLEEQFHYSRFHISRTFLKHTGKTVMKYYNDKRIEQAKKLLVRGKSVTEITVELNYGSIYAFSRHFKNAVGCAPSEYKG